MKYTLPLLTLLATLSTTYAQTTIPACATTCIADAVKSATTCGADDLACQCEASNESAIQSASTSCVLSSCGNTEALTVLQDAQAICSSVLAAGSSSSQTSTSPTVTSSSTTATTTSTVESTSTSTSAVIASTSTTHASSSSSSFSSSSSSRSSTPTTTASRTTNGTATSTTGTTPTSSFTGAAVQVGASFGGAVALCLVAVAVL